MYCIESALELTLTAQCSPQNFASKFGPNVPQTLIDCISDLLRYDPEIRLSSRECMEHPYLVETLAFNRPPVPAVLQM